MATPDRFYPLLLLFHAFPLHVPLTLFFYDAPFGRFAQKTSKWNLNGNFAWFCMEIVAPTTMITTLVKTSHPSLPLTSKILAGVYITHYAQRAIISPLVLSPKRSSLHLIVPVAAACWNLLNASLMAMGLAFFPPKHSVTSPRFIFGVLGWAIGLYGNIYHDEILNDLRRPPSQRLVSKFDKAEEDDKKASGGRYAIPRGALFEYVAFPNYTCEWFEWLCYAIAAGPVFLPVPPKASLQFPWWAPLDYLPFWPNHLLSPAWMFLVAELAAMIPRAVRSQAWYIRTFGKRYPKDRKIVFPWIF